MANNIATLIQPTTRRRALASIKKGVLETPVRVLIYGGEKVGKSSFAAGAPKPIFLGAESGTERLNVERMQPTDWREALDWVGDLASESHDYKTLVVDPLGWLEPMAWAVITESAGGGTIEEYGGGFGKGYTAAVDHWRELIAGLERCWRQRNMNIVLVAHSQVKTFQDPEGPAFDRYELQLNPKAAGLFKQWADCVLFAKLEAFTKVEKGTKRAKGGLTGARFIYTQPSAAYDAGSRWKLPEQLPLSWDDFWGALQDEIKRPGELGAQIVRLVKELGDESISTYSLEFLERNRADADKLVELVNRLSIKVDELKKSVTGDHL